MTGQPAHPPARVSTSSDRLQRLLALVPYVISRKVVGLSETAAAFGVSERELVDDLNMLWCVELRAPDPYCPIDLSYEGGEIVVSQAESMDRPLRLGVDEASALLVALRMLAEVGQVAPVPGLAEGSALSRTIAKLEAAAGEAGAPSAQVAVQVDQNAERRRRGPGARGARRRPPGPPVLLRARARRGDRAGRGPDAAAGGGGPDLPGGMVPQRGGGAPVPARPRARGSRCSRWRPRCREEAEPVRRRPRPLPALARGPAGGDRALAVRALGGRVLPVRGGDRLGEGWLRVVLRTPDSEWVRRLALRLGEDGRVVEPAELAADVRREAAAALARYGSGRRGSRPCPQER